MATITEWLASFGMSEYARRFADNRIDDISILRDSILRDLTDQDREEQLRDGGDRWDYAGGGKR